MYIERINDLHTSLLKREDVLMHSFIINPPLPKDELSKLSAGFSLHQNIVRFYEEMNGFQMSYNFRSNEDFQKEKFGYYQQTFPPMWPNENYWHLDGCVNMLPIDFILTNNWKDYIWFDSEEDNTIEYKGSSVSQMQFEKELKPIDIFSKSSIAVLFMENQGCDILLSKDHNASYTDYKPIHFDEYLDGILRTQGMIGRRPEIFTKV